MSEDIETIKPFHKVDEELKFHTRIQLAEELKQRIHKALINGEFKTTSLEEVVIGFFDDTYRSAHEASIITLSKYQEE